jgi:hypothetical protein
MLPGFVPIKRGDPDISEDRVLKTARTIAALALAAALVAVPSTALAAKGGHGKGKGKAKSCAKAHTRGFQLTGTLVSLTADDLSTTDSSEATLTLTVTAANRHARNSGELEDQNADRKGVQVVGGTYTLPAGDAFVLQLGDDGALVPAAGDRVKVKGRIALTQKRCSAEGAAAADRYDAPDVTRVKVSHPEPATEAETETETPTETGE